MRTRKTFDITEKTRIYHTLAQLTSSFSSIVRYCEELEQFKVLTAKYRHLFQAFTVEIQAQLNSKILEELDHVEMADSARGSRVREKWERWLRFEDEKSGKKKPKKAQKASPQKRTGSGASIK
jgi:hypothetical protein